MKDILAVLDNLCEYNNTYHYHIDFEFNNRIYNIVFVPTTKYYITISSTPYDDLVEVWTSKHSPEEDGVRILKDTLLDYLLHVIKTELN